jgi:starvation-inducible DNA-binding protein
MEHTHSSIGLDKHKSEKLAKKLNTLLANYQLFYMNTRGFHWNIKGDNFFELHLKFEEIYNNLQLKIDEIAERILTLGYTPLHSFSEYLKESGIKEKVNSENGKSSLAEILFSLEIIIQIQRELLALSADAEDEGTNALMSDYIREQEKMIWMYSAYLHK